MYLQYTLPNDFHILTTNLYNMYVAIPTGP